MTDVVGAPALFAQARRNGTWQLLVATLAILLCLIALGALFPAAAKGALRVWLASPTFNHCFLVLPLSLFMIWRRREALAGVTLEPDIRAVFIMIPLAFAWLVAALAGVLEAEQFVILSMVQVLLFGLLGRAFYRALAAPFLYLYFLVPSGAFLIPWLQAFTAHFAVAGLHVLGIPVFSNGAVIEIPAGTFAVAEACAGLRFLVAAIAFGVFYAVLTYRSVARRVAFIALSVAVPIIANGFRALGLIVAAQWIGNPQSALADHILYGWVFFSVVLVILILAGNLFSDRKDEVHASPVPAAATASCTLVQAAAIFAVCFALAASAPIAASYLDTPRQLAIPKRAPHVLSVWIEDRPTGDWTPARVKPARIFAQAFVRDSDRLDRYIAIYPNSGRGSLIRSDDRDANESEWNFESERSGFLTVRREAVPVRVTSWANGDRRRLVWSFYVVNGVDTSSPWAVKWNQLRTYLTANSCASAYIAISSQTADEEEGKRAVESLLGATEPLAPYLCGTAGFKVRR